LFSEELGSIVVQRRRHASMNAKRLGTHVPDQDLCVEEGAIQARPVAQDPRGTHWTHDCTKRVLDAGPSVSGRLSARDQDRGEREQHHQAASHDYMLASARSSIRESTSVQRDIASGSQQQRREQIRDIPCTGTRPSIACSGSLG
jgi:hypothetical protein